MKRSFEVFADRRQLSSWIDLFIVSPAAEGSDRMAVGMVTMFEQSNESVVNPSLTLSQKDAQHLMDQLWQCGLRPSEGTGSAGAMKALELHLQDMRHIVFKGKAP